MTKNEILLRFLFREKSAQLMFHGFCSFVLRHLCPSIRGKGQIIRQFTRLHLRGMELANILSE